MTTPTKRATGTRTPSRDVQTALVDAAEAVLVREGLTGVTVRAVATEAGVAPMGVYNRFGSKEALVEALLIRGFDGLSQAVAAHGELDPEQRLRAAGLRYREFALANQQHYALMFGGTSLDGEPSPELRTCADAAFGALVGHVETAMAAGRMRKDEPTEVAQQIWSTVHGAVTLEIQAKVFTPDPQATYLALLDLVIRGLR